jgi:hypothetical protein
MKNNKTKGVYGQRMEGMGAVVFVAAGGVFGLGFCRSVRLW